LRIEHDSSGGDQGGDETHRACQSVEHEARRGSKNMERGAGIDYFPAMAHQSTTTDPDLLNMCPEHGNKYVDVLMSSSVMDIRMKNCPGNPNCFVSLGERKWLSGKHLAGA
jgi:hypothetical protein